MAMEELLEVFGRNFAGGEPPPLLRIGKLNFTLLAK
jgi:hypothetical protein